MPICTTYYKTAVGELVLGSLDEQLCLADWRYRKMRRQVDDRIQRITKQEYLPGRSQVLDQTISELDEYFRDKRSQFEIPLMLVGTNFQREVWNELLSIPFGETSSYLELSRKLGDEKAIRAVASANGANSIAIIVPCHRIIGSNGDLVGYAGGLKVKQSLLQLEGAFAKQTELNLFPE